MITLKRSGMYRLIETKKNTKILYLDNDIFAWVDTESVGEILVVSHKTHKSDCLLSLGHYKIYDVVDEPYLSDQIHLELEAGKNSWQGYLLLTGLPDDHKIRGRIIPTNEIIVSNPRYKDQKRLGR